MASGTEKSSPGKRGSTAEKQQSSSKASKAEKKLAPLSHNQILVNKRKIQLQNNEVDVSGSIVHEEHILEAIDQMRKRKARPDVDRICAYMHRHYHVNNTDATNDLARLILIEKVIEVDYKGSTSYRNASKWTKLQNYKQATSQDMVKEKINLDLVTSVITELLIDEPDYLDQGVPPSRLIEHLLDGVMNPSSKRIVKDFLSKEVTNGNVIRLSNGNFSLTSPKQPDRNMINSVTSTNTPQQNGNFVSKIKNSSSLSLLSGGYAIHYNGDSAEENGNSLKSSRQEKMANISSSLKKGEESFKQNGCTISSNLFSDSDMKNVNEPQIQQKKSKAERKQRLCVRSDDSSDLLFKFEDYRKDNSYKDEDRRYMNISEDEDCDHDAGRSSTNPSPTPSSSNTGNLRSARRKRAKKVFDPSDNMVVKKKRGRYANATKPTVPQDNVKPVAVTVSPKDPQRHCSLCSKDKQESLIACRDCTVRAHPSCIYSADEVTQKSNSSWQCERCKTCVICFETSEIGALISCYSCDDAYHHSCHTPRIPLNKVKWFCDECNVKQPKQSSKNSLNTSSNKNSNLSKNSNNHNNSNIKNSNTHSNSSIKNSNTHSNSIAKISSSHNNSNTNNYISIEIPSIPSVPTRLSPELSPIRNGPENMDDENSGEIDPNIPDASDWTTEQVYQYFARLFPKEAEIFRVQQIDGHSLLLLKRSDVLKGLDLLLGPALKIYRHVLKLQVRRDDPQLYWL